MPTQQELERLQQAVNVVEDVANGPATGTDSEVATLSGPIKTVARVVSELAATTIDVATPADWAEEGNTDPIPDDKIPEGVARDSEVTSEITSTVQVWARDITTPIPANKLPDDIGSGLDETEVDNRVRAGVQDWAETNNLDRIPESKISTEIARSEDVPDVEDWALNNNNERIPSNKLPTTGIGLDQQAVDNRIAARVQDWAETGNTDIIPENKLPEANTFDADDARAVVLDWAEEGNTDQIPNEKLDERDTITPGVLLGLSSGGRRFIDQGDVVFDQAWTNRANITTYTELAEAQPGVTPVAIATTFSGPPTGDELEYEATGGLRGILITFRGNANDGGIANFQLLLASTGEYFRQLTSGAQFQRVGKGVTFSWAERGNNDVIPLSKLPTLGLSHSELDITYDFGSSLFSNVHELVGEPDPTATGKTHIGNAIQDMRFRTVGGVEILAGEGYLEFRARVVQEDGTTYTDPLPRRFTLTGLEKDRRYLAEELQSHHGTTEVDIDFAIQLRDNVNGAGEIIPGVRITLTATQTNQDSPPVFGILLLEYARPIANVDVEERIRQEVSVWAHTDDERPIPAEKLVTAHKAIPIPGNPTAADLNDIGPGIFLFTNSLPVLGIPIGTWILRSIQNEDGSVDLYQEANRIAGGDEVTYTRSKITGTWVDADVFSEVESGGGGEGGLNELQVDNRIATWARASNQGGTADIPDGAISDNIARLTQVEDWAEVGNTDIIPPEKTDVVAWALNDNTDQIPANKLQNAPAGSGGGLNATQVTALTVTGGSVEGTTLTLTKTGGDDVTITGLPSGSGSGGGLDEAAVDLRVQAGVEDWAETGNTDIIPENKIVSRMGGVAAGLYVLGSPSGTSDYFLYRGEGSGYVRVGTEPSELPSDLINSLAFHDGLLYGVSTANNLYSIDPETGVAQQVGSTLNILETPRSLVSHNGTLFLFSSHPFPHPGVNYRYSIDTIAGTASQVGAPISGLSSVIEGAASLNGTLYLIDRDRLYTLEGSTSTFRGDFFDAINAIDPNGQARGMTAFGGILYVIDDVGQRLYTYTIPETGTPVFAAYQSGLGNLFPTTTVVTSAIASTVALGGTVRIGNTVIPDTDNLATAEQVDEAISGRVESWARDGSEEQIPADKIPEAHINFDESLFTTYVVGQVNDALYRVNPITQEFSRVGNVQGFGVNEFNPTGIANILGTLYVTGERRKLIRLNVNEDLELTGGGTELAADNTLPEGIRSMTDRLGELIAAVDDPHSTAVSLIDIDKATGTSSNSRALTGTTQIADITTSPTGEIHGCCPIGTVWNLCLIPPAGGPVIPVGAFTSNGENVTINTLWWEGNTLKGISNEIGDDDIYVIDPSTGAMRELAMTNAFGVGEFLPQGAVAVPHYQSLPVAVSWARQDNTDIIPTNKLPALGLDEAAVDLRVQAGVADWAETDNNDPIPADKLANTATAAFTATRIQGTGAEINGFSSGRASFVISGNAVLGLPAGEYLLVATLSNLNGVHLNQEATNATTNQKFIRHNTDGIWTSSDTFVEIGGGSGGGLDEAAVDARVEAGVEDWAETGNTDLIPGSKLPPSDAPLTLSDHYVHIGTPNLSSTTETGVVSGAENIKPGSSATLTRYNVRFDNSLPMFNIPSTATYNSANGDIVLPAGHWLICASLNVVMTGAGNSRAQVDLSINHGTNQRHSQGIYLRGDGGFFGSDAINDSQGKLSVTGAVVSDGITPVRIRVAVSRQSNPLIIEIRGAHVHGYQQLLGGFNQAQVDARVTAVTAGLVARIEALENA